MARFVTLVNRSSKTLKGVWDGRQYDLAPGKHSFPEFQAIKFKEQNPILGTEDPYSLQKDYLMGIVEFGDPIDPAEQSDQISLMDLREKIKSGEYKVVKASGLYSPARDGNAPLPMDSNFVKP